MHFPLSSKAVNRVITRFPFNRTEEGLEPTVRMVEVEQGVMEASPKRQTAPRFW